MWQEFQDLINFDDITNLISSIKDFLFALIDLLKNVFGWLGDEILIILLIAIPTVIILRILGR